MTADPFRIVMGADRGTFSRTELAADHPPAWAAQALTSAADRLTVGDCGPALSLLADAGSDSQWLARLRRGVSQVAVAEAIDAEMQHAWELGSRLGLDAAGVALPDRDRCLAAAADTLVDVLADEPRMLPPDLQAAATDRVRAAVADELSARIAEQGFAGVRAALKDHSRNLASWVANRRPGLTRRESEQLRVKLLDGAAVRLALDFWATGTGGQSRVDVARSLLWTGCRRALGDDVPLPPVPPY